MLNPLETGVPSKTKEFDESIAFDHGFWAGCEPVLKVLKQSQPRKSVWSFSYPQYTAQFLKAAKALQLKLVPYQARHSGASDDFRSGKRTLAEIKKRGNWRSDRSLHRYEKAGRLSVSWLKHSTETRAKASRCALELTGILVHGKTL